jgi:hypothetical protein
MHETVPIIKDRVAVDGERVAFLRTSAVFKLSREDDFHRRW